MDGQDQRTKFGKIYWSGIKKLGENLVGEDI